MPFGRAAASTCAASEPAPRPSPAVRMIAAATPSSAAAATTCGTIAAGVVTTTRSGTHGRSLSRLTVRMPSISAWRGLTQPICPAKPPARRLRTTARPAERSRGLPPTTATERGRNTVCR